MNIRRAIVRGMLFCSVFFIFVFSAGQAKAIDLTAGVWTPFNFPGSLQTFPSGIDGNVIVGTYLDSNYHLYAFRYNGSTWTTSTFGVPWANYIYPVGVSGDNIVGIYDNDIYENGILVEPAFFFNGITWVTSTFSEHAPAGSTKITPTGIFGNNIVGWYKDSAGFDHGFLFDGANWTTLDAPGAFGTTANGIFENMIIGACRGGSAGYRTFLYDGSVWTVLDAPNQLNGTLSGIYGNYIIGNNYSLADDYKVIHGFIYDIAARTTTILDAPGMDVCGDDCFYAGTYPMAISGNKVVGSYRTATVSGNSGSGFIYTIPDGTQTPAQLAFSSDYQNGISTSTMFLPNQPTFQIAYSDPNGLPATAVNVVVGGIAYPMSTSDGGNTIYSFTAPADAFTFGEHHYYFEASNGFATTTLSGGGGDLMFTIRHQPVILIPGIAGTELAMGDELIWLNLEKVLWPLGDTFLDALEMNPEGSSKNEIRVVDVMRVKELVGVPVFKYFSTILNALSSIGYQENTDLFVFPYDWRVDNKMTSEILNKKINEITGSSGTKVDVVAHSMGGLIAKQYIHNHSSSKIDHLIFMGTPHLGAPKSAKSLIFGDDMGVRFGVSFLNEGEVKKITQNMPAVYQLLPSKEYVNQAGSYLTDWFTKLDFTRSKNFLQNTFDLNGGLLDNGENFHDDLDSVSLGGSSTKTYNLAGCKTATLKEIRKTPLKYFGSFGSGDETVPLQSADPQNLSAIDFYVKEAEHSKMPSQDNVIEMVEQILTGAVDVSNLPQNVTTNKEECRLVGTSVMLNSPLHLHIYDSFGNHVGPTASGTIEYSIPGVTYEMMDHTKLAFLPDGRQYTVKLEAYATGTFDLRIATIDNDETTRTVYYGGIPTLAKSWGEFNVASLYGDIDFEFDVDGNGNFEMIPVTSVLDSAESADYTPPTTSISITGTAGNDGWYRSKVKVSFVPSDDLSGVLKIQYSLDDGMSWKIYNGQFEIQDEGTTTIIYKSVDRAGNEEGEKTLPLHIDFTAPEALISFDPVQKDIVVNGIDNLSDVTVTDQGDKIILSDLSGNSTALNLDEKNRRKLLSATLKSIQYNGVELNKINNNKFLFRWNYDKNGVLKALDQKIMVKKDFAVLAFYNLKQDMTYVRGRDVDSGKIKQKINGLALIKIQTNKGKLDYEF